MNEEKDNIIKKKSFDFAVDIINLYKALLAEEKEYVLSKQIVRAGTSIGANVREACNAESKADFIHKMGIAQKEADETLYWLELLEATMFITKDNFEKNAKTCSELLKIIRSIIITSKSRNHV
jgi:four helix bundle protein